MHADGGTGSAKMAESERELLSDKSVGSQPPPVSPKGDDAPFGDDIASHWALYQDEIIWRKR